MSGRTPDRLVRAGAAVFVVGLLATGVTVGSLLLGRSAPPPVFWWLAMLLPAGLGIALLGLVPAARARRDP